MTLAIVARNTTPDMFLQEEGRSLDQIFMCREDIKFGVEGKTQCFHTLHDWGATQTLITPATASEAGLMSIQHSVQLVSGLGGMSL